MSAALEFHWPGTAHTTSLTAAPAPRAPAHSPPDERTVEALLARLLAAHPAQFVALADKADCERRMHNALEQVHRVERQLQGARAELAEAKSTVEAQRLHIEALRAELRLAQPQQAATPADPSFHERVASPLEIVRRVHKPRPGSANSALAPS